MKTLTEESRLLLKTYCTLKGITGEIDEHGNVLEVKKVKGQDSQKTVLGITVKTKGPDHEEKVIKSSLQELMSQCIGVTYDPNAIVQELIRVGLLEGQK